MPGSVTENPDITKTNSLNIRSISNNNVSALGTALIIDGAGVSNDANMQMLSSGEAANANSSAGGGVDVRQISTDNIESIEVIRGIPSAEYGDMTSGAVIVKTKTGVTPWAVRIKADPSLKQIYAGKGLSLGENKGVMNFDVDYALAHKDVRSPVDAYNRVNLQVGYSKTFKQKFTFNAKLSGNYSKASSKEDPDNFLDNLTMQKDLGVRLNLNGRWIINKPWITNLEYVVSGSYLDQYSRDREYKTPGRTPGSTSMNMGENIGYFTPFEYYSDVSIFGNPIDAQAKLIATQFGQYGSITNKVMFGLEWKSQGNIGDGKVFDPMLPPSPGTASALRERPFSDVPFLHRYTAFLEDKFKVKVNQTYFELQAGIRANGLLSDGIINQADMFSIEPRFNGRYVIRDAKEGLKKLSVRAGWGLSYKMPSMVFLYPEAAYADMISYSYNDIDENDYSLAVMSTYKTNNTTNPELKIQRSRNIEVGIDFAIDPVVGSVVYFNEKLKNGYGFSKVVEPFAFKRYGYTWENGIPTQIKIPGGKKPVYQNGDVYVDGKELPYITDTTFVSYSRANNNMNLNKWGVEFTLDFAQIKAINTSISVSGAYMNIASQFTGLESFSPKASVGGRDYPYVGIYGGGLNSNNTSVDERFSTNIRFITHIPKISMVVTLTAQMVFMDRSTKSYECDGSNQVYYYDDNNVRHTGSDAQSLNNKYVKHVNPRYIMDRTGDVKPFTQDMEKDPQYDKLIIKTNTSNYYLKQGYPFYGLLNLRVTKEIKKLTTISFYANNFLNLKGRVENNVTGYPQNKNTGIYFGAEVKFTF